MPGALCARETRPDSLRGKAPPINSLYVFGTDRWFIAHLPVFLRRFLGARYPRSRGGTPRVRVAHLLARIPIPCTRQTDWLDRIGLTYWPTPLPPAVHQQRQAPDFPFRSKCPPRVRRVCCSPLRLPPPWYGRGAPRAPGPKIPPRASRWGVCPRVKIVGANQKPVVGMSQTELHRCAPSASPTAASSVIRSNCSREWRPPMPVFLSSGPPSPSVGSRDCSRSMTSS